MLFAPALVGLARRPIEFRSAATLYVDSPETTATSISVPNGYAINDFLLFVIVVNETVTPPAGVTSELSAGALKVFSKKVTAPESSFAFTLGGESSHRLTVLAYKNASNVAQMGSANTDNLSEPTDSITAPGVTAIAGTLLWIGGHSFSRYSLDTIPSGMTQRYADTTQELRSYVFDQTISAGTTGGRTATFTRSVAGSDTVTAALAVLV